MAIVGGYARAALAMVLGAAAVVFWLTTGPAGHAASSASATQAQALAASVSATISWGTNQPGNASTKCTQAMGTANFGEVAAGGNNTQTGFVGCVTSNKTWNVGVHMDTPLTNTNGASNPLKGNQIQITDVGGSNPAGATHNCTTACTLNSDDSTDTSVLTGATPLGGGKGSELDYSLTLNVPAAATGGTYTNGDLTFTASN